MNRIRDAFVVYFVKTGVVYCVKTVRFLGADDGADGQEAAGR